MHNVLGFAVHTRILNKVGQSYTSSLSRKVRIACSGEEVLTDNGEESDDGRVNVTVRAQCGVVCGEAWYVVMACSQSHVLVASLSFSFTTTTIIYVLLSS